MDGFVGEIRLLPYNFTPMYWRLCDGGILYVQNFQALFAVIGNHYGGDGRNTFAVPNLNGRTAVAAGNNPTDVFDPNVTQSGGSSVVTLFGSTVPTHTHSLVGATLPQAARVAAPLGNFLAPAAYVPTSGTIENSKAFTPPQPTPPPGVQVTMNAASLAPFPGQGHGHENRQPYLAMGYFICTEGLFPQRN